MNAPTQAGLPSLPLKDPKLFRTQSYIDGEWTGNGRTFPIVNPATGAQLAAVPDLGAAEARRAIEAAERAWPGVETVWDDGTIAVFDVSTAGKSSPRSAP